MVIKRIEPAERWCEAVIHNQVLYYTSVPSNLINDAYQQTKSALAEIDIILERAGSDKSQILDATIFLVNKSDFPLMNKAWDEWVVKGSPPVRCTVQAGLMNDAYLVEIKIVAVTKN